jgi:hypothetical protein
MEGVLRQYSDAQPHISLAAHPAAAEVVTELVPVT